MMFKPELAAKVLAREKTVTRRVMSDNPRSPWWREKCTLVPGRDYAVCPGRGKHQVGRVIVSSVTPQTLIMLDTDEEARREGFPTVDAFRDAWEQINGGFDPGLWVWRIAFRLVSA